MSYIQNIYCGRQYGEYTIIKSIAEGRYGMCFLAHSISGTQVIIKKFKPSILKKNADKNYYEAVILSKLNHSAIPELLGVINEKGFYGFVLELKQGTTVKDMLFKQNHIFSNKEVYLIGNQLINALKHLQQNGIVHRDISTQNVLVSDTSVSLLDFGLARYEDSQRYTRDIDYFCFGDLLLYLLYSSFKKTNILLRPWYNELPIDPAKKLFLKRLLKIEKQYDSIDQIKEGFEIFHHY